MHIKLAKMILNDINDLIEEAIGAHHLKAGSKLNKVVTAKVSSGKWTQAQADKYLEAVKGGVRNRPTAADKTRIDLFHSRLKDLGAAQTVDKFKDTKTSNRAVESAKSKLKRTESEMRNKTTRTQSSVKDITSISKENDKLRYVPQSIPFGKDSNGNNYNLTQKRVRRIKDTYFRDGKFTKKSKELGKKAAIGVAGGLAVGGLGYTLHKPKQSAVITPPKEDQQPQSNNGSHLAVGIGLGAGGIIGANELRKRISNPIKRSSEDTNGETSQ